MWGLMNIYYICLVKTLWLVGREIYARVGSFELKGLIFSENSVLKLYFNIR